MYIVIIHSHDVTGYVTKRLLIIISIINWFVFVCFNYATKNNMLGSNILDKAMIPVWCFSCFETWSYMLHFSITTLGDTGTW